MAQHNSDIGKVEKKLCTVALHPVIAGVRLSIQGFPKQSIMKMITSSIEIVNVKSSITKVSFCIGHEVYTGGVDYYKLSTSSSNLSFHTNVFPDFAEILENFSSTLEIFTLSIKQRSKITGKWKKRQNLAPGVA
ncbi:hypothetical protein Tsp_04204 [Trichinella spiralis]|uniref:hypothetical protein n=1 Tax=Trichinella spiralis TaxID=6334 RepID=UPI0001EFBB34|nr:hypothetical protein Tsp_04204 [Trichinella spiralis]